MVIGQQQEHSFRFHMYLRLSKEPIEFKDLCETKAVSTNLYLDFNEGYPDVNEYENILSLREKREKGTKMTKKDMKLLEDTDNLTEKDLEDLIEPGHNYVFVGKVGLFCPVKEGTNGGILLREQNNKLYSANGSKGYRWKESENVDDESIIDKSYYISLVDQAIETISEYGDAEAFVA